MSNSTHTVAEINDADFQEKVLDSSLPVLVDFWAPWCAPCKMIAPIVEQMADEFQGKMQVFKLNVDNNPRTGGEYGILSIPTQLVFAGQGAKQPLERIVGYQPASRLRAKLTDLLES